jgi:hypothetical protein
MYQHIWQGGGEAYSNYEYNTSSSTTRNTRKILIVFQRRRASTCTFTVTIRCKTGHLVQRHLAQQRSTATEETTGMRYTAHLNVFVRGRNVVLKTTAELTDRLMSAEGTATGGQASWTTNLQGCSMFPRRGYTYLHTYVCMYVLFQQTGKTNA